MYIFKHLDFDLALSGGFFDFRFLLRLAPNKAVAKKTGLFQSLKLLCSCLSFYNFKITIFSYDISFHI